MPHPLKALDYVGTLRSFAGDLNMQFAQRFARRSLAGRIAIFLNDFDHLDTTKGLKLIADACNKNFRILGQGMKDELQPVRVGTPLRESFETMLGDVGAACALNFERLR